MVIETLKGVEKIDGFNVVHSIRSDEQLKTDDKTRFVEVCHSNNTITFRIQEGPVKENGVNGCQVDTLIQAARLMLFKLNEKFPCDENDQAIDMLGGAIRALENRRLNREKRGVEGLNKE